MIVVGKPLNLLERFAFYVEHLNAYCRFLVRGDLEAANSGWAIDLKLCW